MAQFISSGFSRREWRGGRRGRRRRRNKRTTNPGKLVLNANGYNMYPLLFLQFSREFHKTFQLLFAWPEDHHIYQGNLARLISTRVMTLRFFFLQIDLKVATVYWQSHDLGECLLDWAIFAVGLSPAFATWESYQCSLSAFWDWGWEKLRSMISAVAISSHS